VGPRATMDVMEKRNNYFPNRKSNRSSTVAQHHSLITVLIPVSPQKLLKAQYTTPCRFQVVKPASYPNTGEPSSTAARESIFGIFPIVFYTW
jgi:hypothetical protein